MIEAIGLTSNPRKELPPAVDDVSFEAHAGRVTALLGAPGAGKTTALRLLLGLQGGRGVAHFRGRPLHRIPQPASEVGVLLGDVPGHPARTVRGHLHMLCAAVGAPGDRADEVLEAVGLVSLRDARLGTLSRGADRRLGLACALLADPHTLVLDQPTRGLPPRDHRWLHALLRAHAEQGGTVLCTTADPKEAARIGDHVVTLDGGRVVADQDGAEFSRTRLRPRVAVRSPHAARLSVLLRREARTARRSVEVVPEGGNRLCVYGSTCADVGEIAFRNGIVVHQLADEVGDMGPGAGDDRPAAHAEAASDGGATPDDGPASVGSAQGPGSAPEKGPAPEPVPEPPNGPEREQERQRNREAEPEPGPGPEAEAAPRSDPGPKPGRSGQDPAPGLGAEPRPGPEAPQAPEPSPAPAPAPAPALAPVPSPLPSSSSSPFPSPVSTVAAVAAESSPGRSPEQDVGRGAAAPAPAGEPRPAAPSRNPLAGGTGTAPTGPVRLPPPLSVRPAPAPLRPLRYEIRRAVGTGTGWKLVVAVILVSALTAVVLARIGHTPQPRLLAAWPRELPLPPAAIGAGLLGALAFGEEFRHPVLAADRGTVSRRLGLLLAKLLVASLTALPLAVLTVVCDAQVLSLVHGPEFAGVPADWPVLSAGWLGLVTGCAWAGVLGAGLFRSTTAGLAVVVAVPLLVVPALEWVTRGTQVRSAVGFPQRVREALPLRWPFGGEQYLDGALRMVGQPVGGALVLSVGALACAFVLSTRRGRVR
ncbi:ATP-binding cassette domain-containing protein [Streptomyces sp. enrichment culture]|uniref:ATP-binding cassette domain-containing protein n=1 Tax=Streptomyces sp. enrichment culture TaxID=1795815 RepID=UPI003F5738FC